MLQKPQHSRIERDLRDYFIFKNVLNYKRSPQEDTLEVSRQVLVLSCHHCLKRFCNKYKDLTDLRDCHTIAFNTQLTGYVNQI